MHFLLVHSPSETFDHKRFPTPKMALIRGKTALMFSEFSILVPIWLSGAEPTQKITANSTYWKAKLKGAGGVARSKPKEHLFWVKIGKFSIEYRRKFHSLNFSITDITRTTFHYSSYHF